MWTGFNAWRPGPWSPAGPVSVTENPLQQQQDQQQIFQPLRENVYAPKNKITADGTLTAAGVDWPGHRG